MYSLRDPNGLPHVTADIDTWDEDPDPDLPTPKNRVVQLRGKQNAAPDRKYWEYVRALLDKMEAFVADTEAMGLRHLSPWTVRQSTNTWQRNGRVQEAPAKDKALTAQRNIPREVVNVMTSEPAMRQTVWELSVMPKGTQAARLMRYLEDKGWRQVKVDGRRLMYHGRSFKLLEPVRPLPDWTLHAVYSLFRPLQADDTDHIDRALLKSWGYDQGLTGDMISVASTPSARFISSVTSPEVRERADYVSDQLHQHTGIVLEPLAGRVPNGEPVRRSELSATRLPQGVGPSDLVVVAEGGSFYVLLAKSFSPAAVHDSTAVISKGQTRVDDRRAPERPDDDEASDEEFGASWGRLQRKYGVTHGPSRKARPVAGPDPRPTSDIHVAGDGGLTRAYERAKSLDKDHVYLVAAPARQIDPTPIPLEYSREGIYGEDVRVARTIRQTGGLPVRPGRWRTEDLGKFLRMFRRDYGTSL